MRLEIRQPVIHSGRTRLTTASDRRRPAPPAGTARGTTRLVYTNISTAPDDRRRRREHTGHGLSVIEHALMIIIVAGLVILLFGAVGHAVSGLWQSVNSGLSA